MTPQKRKADAASPPESSEETPHKWARCENTVDSADKQDGNTHLSHESSDEYAEHSIPEAQPSSNSHAAPGKENEAAIHRDLPQTWDQADTADKMLVKLKQENKNFSWARIEQLWERSTCEKPTEGVQQWPHRYRHLLAIKTRSGAGGASKEKVGSKVIEEPLEISDAISTLPIKKVRHSSPVMDGPSGKSSHAISKRLMTAAKPSNPATDGPSDKSSRAIPKRSKTAAKPSKAASAAPTSGDAPENDLPQSWEQANAGDQLIVSMKTSRIAWARIKKAWQELTGQTAAEGALEDRYTRIKELVIRPGTNGAYTYSSQRPKSSLKTIRKRKPEAESSEESLDNTSDETSDESSDEISKRPATMARRKPRGAVEQKMGAFDGPSDQAISNPTKNTAEERSDSGGGAEFLDELDENSKHSMTVTQSAKRPRVKPPITANSGAQNTIETANEMLVEMRERGCTWVEISKAWAKQTGLAHVPETLRLRYARIKNSSAQKDSATKLKSTTQASSKRKAKATSPAEGSCESSMKRSKSTPDTPHVTETSNKRNMDRGKRKSSVKYADSTTDEDEVFAVPVEPVATTSTKRNAGRAAKVNRSDPEWLVTNEKSPLAYENLYAEFSDPKTYEKFTKSDWEDIRETLPPNVPTNPDGYSIPMKFFKHDSDFRRGIREFQEDLASGRLDPKWQADAAQAMEERARGDFDAYKENQFEAFWGQKQKLNHDVLAGESTKIKLELLIQNEVFKVGDYFSYSRVFGRGKSGLLVEKDCKIVKVDGKALTFAIPPGQRKYSRRMFESGMSRDSGPGAKAAMAGGDGKPATGVKRKSGAARAVACTETKGGEISGTSKKLVGASLIKTAENGNQLDNNAQEADVTSDNKTNDDDEAEAIIPEGTAVEVNTESEGNEIHEDTAPEGNNENGATAQTNRGQSSRVNTQEEDVLHSISILTQLENKIVDIDGHFNSKDIATQNTWKSFRGIRDNQDLGTLFEMREAFHVYKHPRIVKEAKKKR